MSHQFRTTKALEMLDTLSEFLFRIQNQLEKTRVLDLAKSQKAEQEMVRYQRYMHSCDPNLIIFFKV